ncbi:MAG: putative metal-binding motif-containing protein [Polyangiaceae bacterium]|nr:putative metal-binding motif-containing protein [Polyangiaceae bacterium]
MSLAIAAGLFLLLTPLAVHARAGGIAAGSCAGCHGGSGDAKVTIEPSSLDVAFGQTIQLKVSVETPRVAGMYLYTSIACAADGDPSTPDPGTYQVLNGQQTIAISGSGEGPTGTSVEHSSPKSAQNGVTTFLVNWTAPQKSCGVMFTANVLAANGDGGRGGDNNGTAQASVSVGCMGPGTVFFRDFDGDGHGVSGPSSLRACTPPKYYSAVNDDCDDNDERNFPGNTEKCDLRDNNCNSMVDDGLANETLYEDGDKDGYGKFGGMTHVGCTGMAGWGVGQDDCDDTNPTVHPNATETCNGLDDDCDTRVDDGVLPECGLGWCRRLAYSCGGVCTVGQPRAETCNYFDDDCDGLIDEEPDLCPPGQGCQLGVCVVGASVPPPPPPPPETGGNGPVLSSGGGPAMSSGGAPPVSSTPVGSGSTVPKPPTTGTSGGAKALAPATDSNENVSGCSIGGTSSGAGHSLLTLGLIIAAGSRFRRQRIIPHLRP